MRKVVAAVFIAAILIVFYIVGWDALFLVAAFVFIAVGIAAALRKGPWQSALIAAGVGGGMAALYWLYAVISVGGSSPSCDGFCLSQWQARVFVTVVLLSYASFVAVMSGIFALIFCQGKSRAVA